MSDKHSLRQGILRSLFSEFTSPLKLISYFGIPGLLSPLLALSWQTSTFLFFNIWAPALASLSLLAFHDRDLLREMRPLDWSVYIVILFLGIFGVEFVGMSISAYASFFHEQDYAKAVFLDVISIVYTISGGVVLAITHAIGRHYRHRKFSIKERILIIILIVVLIVVMEIQNFLQHEKEFVDFFTGLFSH